MNRRYQAIFWDNDGVLVDTERLYFEASRQSLAKAGIDLSRELFHTVSLTKGQSVFFLVREAGIAEEEVNELRDERNRCYTDLIQAEERLLIAGVPEVLAELSGSFRMAIVSNSLRQHFTAIHQQTGILDYFEFILVNEDYEKSKPFPDAYLAALAKSGLEASECLVVEDTGRGMQAAVNAGIDCVVIPHDLTRDTDFTAAVAVLNKITEFADWLSKNQE